MNNTVGHYLVAKTLRITYRWILRPALFLCDPEAVHVWFTGIGELLGKKAWTRSGVTILLRYDHPALEQTVVGLKFLNPIGLSAGFDKDGRLVGILPAVGFGFSQVGTITHQPYEGNPSPRLYRLPKSQGIVVYYGLKNDGVDTVLKRVRAQQESDNYPVSISIGKTNCKDTVDMAAGMEDYRAGLMAVADSGLGDFYTINISCPSTFGGEPFTGSEELDQLLIILAAVSRNKPIFLKMPINLEWWESKSLLEVGVKHNIAGVIIGNLNKNYKDETVRDYIPEHIKGGISGRPTWKLSNELISRTYREYGDKLVIIGVGGIFSAEDAYEKIKRGASLVQLITGMIYCGPQLVGEINRGLVKLLKKDGYQNISEAVGAYYYLDRSQKKEKRK